MGRVGTWLSKPQLKKLLLAAPLVVVGLLYAWPASAADLEPRRIMIGDSMPGIVTTYQIGFTIPGPETLGSIEVQFCANDPLFSDPCAVPAGFDISGATLSAQSGETGFSIGPGTTTNALILTRTATPSAGGAVSYTLTGITNPSSGGSLYGRIQTFASTDASGVENEHGGLALSINNGIDISTEVPPYLLFCGGVTIGGFDCNNASGNYLNFGNLTSGGSASASSQLLTATNAGLGFTISVYGLTMTSGNNTIPAINPQDVSRPGTGQFGLNLVANSTPNVGSDPAGPGTAAPLAPYSTADFFRFVSGDAVAGANTADDFKKFTASYVINIPIGQAIGVYTTTLTYVCLANF